jgi:hypothetical protein
MKVATTDVWTEFTSARSPALLITLNRLCLKQRLARYFIGLYQPFPCLATQRRAFINSGFHST